VASGGRPGAQRGGAADCGGRRVGILGALLVGRLVERLLFDVTATDPLSLASAAVAFGGVAPAASLLLAWRAGRVDLMDALRQGVKPARRILAVWFLFASRLDSP
jgi:putative ABC transport system permease protein